MEKSKDFTIIPNKLIKGAGLLFSYSQFRVLLRLISYDWSNIDMELKKKKTKGWGLEIAQKGLVWPSQKTLAEDLGLNITTIQEAVSQLRKIGVIETKRQMNKPNLIRIKYDSLNKLLDTKTVPSQARTQPSDVIEQRLWS
jgi:DNA-binding MarR family transcriptional regulator